MTYVPGFHPLGDYVLIPSRTNKEEKWRGVVIPPSVRGGEYIRQAEVVACGPGDKLGRTADP